MDFRTYATVCSGVEGCSLALEEMGWQPVFFSEIEPFPCAVLKAHYPDIPNLGDMSKITFDQTKGVITNGKRTIQFHGRLDLLAGGTPCQDFSVAGKRAGGAGGSGTRSSLMWELLRLASELRPRVIFWENVVGCLSSNGGRDFAQFVAAVGELGYCVAWRVLDCQYTRVDKWPMAIPQRRRRVWLVGCADAEPSEVAEILFEHRSLVGDTAPRRRTRKEAARIAQDRNPLNARMVEGFFDNVRTGFPTTGDDVNHTVCSKNFYQGVIESIALEGNGQRPSHRGSGINADGAQFTLNCIEQHGVAYKTNPKGEEVSPTLFAGMSHQWGTREEFVNTAVIERTVYNNEGMGGETEVTNTLDCSLAKVCSMQQPIIAETVPFVKTSLAKGKDGEGERWEQSEVAGTRNVFDNGEMRTQEVVISNSNGGDVMPTINANEAKLGGDNQHIDGGGVRCP